MKDSRRLALQGLLGLLSFLGVFQQALGKDPVGVAAMAVEAKKAQQGAFKANENVYVSDEFTTGPQGGITILFEDESVFSLGPNGHAKIEAYEQSTKGSPGKSLIRVHKGQFRYFPGTILEKGGSQLVLGTTSAGALDALTPNSAPPNDYALGLRAPALAPVPLPLPMMAPVMAPVPPVTVTPANMGSGNPAKPIGATPGTPPPPRSSGGQ